MAKRKSRIGKLFGLLRLLLIVGIILVAGIYLFADQLPPAAQEVLVVYNLHPNTSTLTSTATADQAQSILGKTTSMVEEGLQSLKVPKQFTGSQEEIVIQDIFDSLLAKVKDLPNQQADRIKIQFCQDLLSTVDNASVQVNE